MAICWFLQALALQPTALPVSGAVGTFARVTPCCAVRLRTPSVCASALQDDSDAQVSAPLKSVSYNYDEDYPGGASAARLELDPSIPTWSEDPSTILGIPAPLS